MRKILILLSLVALVFIGNFSLWFLHTRSVHQALAQLKRELSHNNIVLSYDDIKFTNFKSWRVDGDVKKVSLKYGTGKSHHISFENLKFQSLPFDKKVTLLVDGKINLINGEESYDVALRDNHYPKMTLNLETTLKNLVETLKDPEEPKLHLIDALTYSDGGFKFYDLKNNELYFEVGPSNLKMSSATNSNEMRFVFAFSLKDLVFNKDYVVSPADKKLHDVALQVGATSLDLQFDYIQSPSKLLLELMSKDKENKKNYKKIFDSYQLKLKALRQVTDVYTINITGDFDRQPDMFLPIIDMNLRVDNYKNFTHNFTDLYNATLDRILLEQPHFPAQKITTVRYNKLLDLLKTMGAVNDTINITIVHRKGEDVMIAGKPIFTVLNEFQNIFNDTVTRK